MSGVWGTTLRPVTAWLCGEGPTARFLDPLLADIQAEQARTRGAGFGAAARLAACSDVLRVVPALVVRAEPSSALAWAAAPSLALATGLVALSASAGVLGLQLAWAAIAVVVLLALRFTGRRLFGIGPVPALLVGLGAFLPTLLSGGRWIRLPLGALVVTPLELARPALLLALGALLGVHARRSGARVGAVVVLAAVATAAAVRVRDPAAALVASLMCAAALSACRARAGWLASGACVALGAFGSLAAVVERPAAWLDAGALRAALAGQGQPAMDVHTDYVLAALGARTGWIGVGLALLAVAAVAWTPLRAAGRGPASAVARALAAWIFVQLVAHAGAALAVLPAWGAPLPIVSYGGSSLVALFAGLGLVAACVDSSSPARSSLLRPS